MRGFVGRRPVMNAALAALAAPPALVVVEGESGVGKSRLLAELVERIGDQYEAVSRELPTAFEGRVLVVVDDAHQLDPAARAALGRLAGQSSPDVALLVAYRRAALPAPGVLFGAPTRPRPGVARLWLRLDPLPVGDVGQLAELLLGRCVGPEFAAGLAALTGGLPALVEDVLAQLPAQVPDGVDPLDGVAVPPYVVDEVAAYRYALPEPARRVVDAAAVLGEPAGESLLATVAELPPARAGKALIDALAAPGPLVEVDANRYGFRHQLACRAAYRMIPGPVRRTLHQRARLALAELAASPATLARHGWLAGEPAHALRHAEAAADSAAAMGDTPAAVAHLRRVLAEPTITGPARARLAGKLGRFAVASLAYQETVDLLRALLTDTALPAGLRGELRLHLGLLLMNQAGDGDRGRAETIQAVAELRRRPALAARAMSALALPYWGSSGIAEHLQWMRRAEAAMATGGEPALMTAVYANRVSLLMDIGDPEAWPAAERLTEHLGTNAQRQQVARAYGNLADAAVWLGHYATAADYVRRATALANECGATYSATSAEATELQLDYARGSWSGLAERAERLLAETRHMPIVAADARLIAGGLALVRGDQHDAAGYADAPGLRTPADGCAPQITAAAALRARILLMSGEVADARAELLVAADRVRDKGGWVWSGDLVTAAVLLLARSGRLGDAARLTDELADNLTGRDAPHATACVLWCRAGLAEANRAYDEAIAAYRETDRLMSRMPRPYDAAQAADAATRCLLAAGHRPTQMLTEVAERYLALGAAMDAARCHRLLRSCGGAPPQRRGRRGYGPQLSPRETEVARLVIHGRSNREIAKLLYLSPRTVEQHVTSLLRKLDVHTRSGIAARLQQE